MNGNRSRITLCAGLVLALLVACSNETPEQLLASAKQYLEAKDVRAAVVQVKTALQKDPDLTEGRVLLADDPSEARAICNSRSRVPEGACQRATPEDVVPAIARSMLSVGNYKGVIDEWHDAEMRTPSSVADLQTTLAAAHNAAGNAELAKLALQKALDADPRNSRALLAQVRLMLSRRDLVGAMSGIDRIVANDPANAEAWQLKGDIHRFGQDDRAQALAAYEKSVAADPTFAPGLVALITVYLHDAKYKEAAATLALLNTAAPGDPRALFLDARLAYHEARYKNANDLVQRLLRTYPTSSRALHLAGAIALQTSSLSVAESYFARAVESEPRFMPAHRSLITTRLKMGNVEGARVALSAIMAHGDLDPDMLSLAGQVSLLSGDAEKAKTYFASALKANPGSASDRTALAISELAGNAKSAAFGDLQSIARGDSGVSADLAVISVLMARREYKQALEAIDRLESKPHDLAMTSTLRGDIQTALGNRDEATKSYERALAASPSYFSAAARLAALDLADKKLASAKGRFEALLKIDPKDTPALLALAKLSAATGSGKDELVGLLSRAVKASPAEPSPRLKLIELLLNHGDIKEALSQAQASALALPDSYELLDALGRVQQLSGAANQAAATYTKLIVLRPNSPDPYLRLADVQAESKDLAAAEKSLRKALEIRPGLLDARRGLTMLAIAAGRFDEALSTAREIQEKRPQLPLGYVLEADVARAQKNWPLAASAYRKGLEKLATPAFAAGLHGALLAGRDEAGAKRFAAQWRREHPEQVEFMLYLGDAELVRNNLPNAELIYLDLLKVHPNNDLALNNLAWVMGRLGKDGAIGHAKRAVELAPNQAMYADTLGMLLAQRREFSEAIKVQKRAVELQASNGQLRLNLAKIYIGAGDKASARAQLEVLAKLGPAFAGQAEVSSLLNSL